MFALLSQFLGRATACLTFLITTSTISYYYLPYQPLRYNLRANTSLISYLNKYDKRVVSDIVLANRVTAYFHCYFVSASCFYLQFNYYPELVDHILHWSASYFLCDLLYVINVEMDFKFILHHLSCIILWLTCLAFNTGKEMAIGGLLVAEMTSLLWIPWETAGMFRWDSLRQTLSYPTMIAYSLLRGCYFPYYLLGCLVKITNLTLPIYSKLPLMVAAVLVGTGSVLWAPRIIKKCLKYGSSPFQTK